MQPEAFRSETVIGRRGQADTEGALLGNMIVLLLEENGFDVVDNTEFGPTDVIRRAIFNDEIDIYPEYTGNGGFFFSGTESSLWQNADTAFSTVAEYDLRENDIVWLQPAPANLPTTNSGLLPGSVHDVYSVPDSPMWSTAFLLRNG